MHEQDSVLCIADGESQVGWRRRRIVFSSPDRDARSEIVRGSDNAKLGWRSRRFNQKQPIPTLRIRIEINGPSTIHTNLEVYS